MSPTSTAFAFLSYSRADQAFAAHLARDLRARGIHLWFDQLDIAPGRNWDAAIHQALASASAVLFLVSPHSVNSENVLNEITVALDSGKWVIPLMLANVPVPLRVARLQRVNFTTDYGAALNHLVAYMGGGGSRTTALEAILNAPAPNVAAPPQRSSIEPVFHTPASGGASRSWLLPAALGLAAGVVGLFLLLIMIGTQTSHTGSANIGASAAQASAAPAPPAEERNQVSPASVAEGAVTPEALQGTWKTSCLAGENGLWLVHSLTFGPTSLAEDFSFSFEAQCAQPRFALNITFDILALTLARPNVFEADLRIGNISLVPIDSAANLNRDGTLGIRQWRDGVPTELPAPRVAEFIGYPYRSGMQVYDLLSVDGSTLHSGKSRGNHMALEPSERPTQFDTTAYVRSL